MGKPTWPSACATDATQRRLSKCFYYIFLASLLEQSTEVH
jgi:hypothetical protein